MLYTTVARTVLMFVQIGRWIRYLIHLKITFSNNFASDSIGKITKGMWQSISDKYCRDIIK